MGLATLLLGGCLSFLALQAVGQVAPNITDIGMRWSPEGSLARDPIRTWSFRELRWTL
jgi:hypothetical protein